jgi:hypothetical protein
VPSADLKVAARRSVPTTFKAVNLVKTVNLVNLAHSFLEAADLPANLHEDLPAELHSLSAKLDRLNSLSWYASCLSSYA